MAIDEAGRMIISLSFLNLIDRVVVGDIEIGKI